MPNAYIGAQILAGSLVNDRFWAANLKEAMALSGHNRPYKMAFQFEYLMRALAHLNGRFSASNLL
jgi:hypothetical protein